jgi:hypothetical protein
MEEICKLLRLRIANRLKILYGANAHIQDAIASGLMTSNGDNAVQKYQNDKLLLRQCLILFLYRTELILKLLIQWSIHLRGF